MDVPGRVFGIKLYVIILCANTYTRPDMRQTQNEGIVYFYCFPLPPVFSFTFYGRIICMTRGTGWRRYPIHVIYNRRK
jgi:hypothetical protein